MKPFLVCLTALALAACGVDGAPIKPKLSGTATVGTNSQSGTFTDTGVTLCVGNAC